MIERRTWRRHERPTFGLVVDVRLWGANESVGVEPLAVEAEQGSELGSANAHRIVQHRLEHRLEITWRTGDDLQHLTRRGLLLQRLGEIVGALAQLVEQASILNGYHCLSGEARQQLDLLFGEGLHFLVIDVDRTDQFAVFQ